jgi:hypothetical protein
VKEDNSLCADPNLLLWLAILSNTPDSTRGHRTSFSLSPLLFLLRCMPKTLNNLFLRVKSSDDDYTRNNYSLLQESTCPCGWKMRGHVCSRLCFLFSSLFFF